jgi:hypothetical protein
MPEAFENCVANGGRVRTRKLGNGKYIHICYYKGKSYASEVHTVKKVKKGKK